MKNSDVQIPFMHKRKRIEDTVRLLARSKVLHLAEELGNFMISLGITEENKNEYELVMTGKAPKVVYTIFKKSDENHEHPLWSKIL
jgi:hypothetical protein